MAVNDQLVREYDIDRLPLDRHTDVFVTDDQQQALSPIQLTSQQLVIDSQPGRTHADSSDTQAAGGRPAAPSVTSQYYRVTGPDFFDRPTTAARSQLPSLTPISNQISSHSMANLMTSFTDDPDQKEVSLAQHQEELIDAHQRLRQAESKVFQLNLDEQRLCQKQRLIEQAREAAEVRRRQLVAAYRKKAQEVRRKTSGKLITRGKKLLEARQAHKHADDNFAEARHNRDMLVAMTPSKERRNTGCRTETDEDVEDDGAMPPDDEQPPALPVLSSRSSAPFDLNTTLQTIAKTTRFEIPSTAFCTQSPLPIAPVYKQGAPRPEVHHSSSEQPHQCSMISDVNIVPKPFLGSPSGDAEAWLAHFNRYVEFHDLNEQDTLRLFGLHMRGDAADWFETLEPNESQSFAFLSAAFKEVYCASPELIWKECQDIWKQVQGADESVNAFVTRLRKCARRVNFNDSLNYAIINGLKPHIQGLFCSKAYRVSRRRCAQRALRKYHSPGTPPHSC